VSDPQRPDQELRKLDDVRADDGAQLTNSTDARRGGRHHGVEAVEDAFEAVRKRQRLVPIAAVQVELAAARLVARECDLVAEPFEDCDGRLRRLREESVAEA